MTITSHTHKLTGCAPIPLAHYLKALGVLHLSQKARIHMPKAGGQETCFIFARVCPKPSCVGSSWKSTGPRQSSDHGERNPVFLPAARRDQQERR